MYITILARSFSKHEQKRLGYGAFLACLFIALSFSTVFKPYLGPLPILNLRLSIMGAGHGMYAVKETMPSHEQENTTAKSEIIVDNAKHDEIQVTKPAKVETKTWNNATSCIGFPELVAEVVKPLCDTTGPRTNFCDVKGDVRVQPSSSSVMLVTSAGDNRSSWKIRPYARKEDKEAMSSVKEWFVRTASSLENNAIPRCTRNHTAPAVLFSAKGYSGNHFHDFNDILIPLYLTSRKFDRNVQFLVTDNQPWWITKFRKIIDNLSRYEIIDIDHEKTEVHCFPRLTLGLRRHGELTIDPARSAYTMKDFRTFLRSSYSLKRRSVLQVASAKPRLLIVARQQTRRFKNADSIARAARQLGFEVIVAEPSMDVQAVAALVNSCDVVVGVHGAGLTNILFLPDEAVLVQVVPVGNVEWISRQYFGEPSKAMDIGYLEYKVSLKESSLIEQYPLDHIVFKDPMAFHKGNWGKFKSVYLDKQDLKLDIKRFRPTLVRALELLREHRDRSVL
ncbi:hypothetical protein SAY87_023455 [Trapa incisa]|uniref:Glycosyltransferase 61 catalytic domain-containing protein n=1 Tax=Trapa incisa TaxID=236973 RepID=A0AAN7L0M4_9MYRT|nr:hypothetical protein SAY87_023455 [Trapa incisa]